MNRRIGIFAGTFNPVHSGHIIFALQASHSAKLDKVYFMVERRPRDKQTVEHYAHRVSMLQQALKPHPQFQVIEFVDINFTIDRTLPKIKSLFPGDDLVMLFGSDVVKQLATWSNASRLLSSTEIVIGLRGNDNQDNIQAIVDSWPQHKKRSYILSSFAPTISSSKVRSALSGRIYTNGILTSVERYSNKHWLYISLA